VARHYGSLYAMADYKSNTINLNLSTSYTFSEDLTFYGSVDYNNAKAELDEVVMPNVYDITGGDLHHLFEDESSVHIFDEMHEYSDLEYGFIGLSF